MAKAIETLSPEDQTIFLEAINDAIETDPGSTKTSLGGVIGGSSGTVANAILRADGTAGDALQSSGLVVGDAVVSITGITGDSSTNVITATGSGFTNEQPIRFTALTGGSGLNTTTNYFVREVSGDTFKLETSIGGGAVNFSNNIVSGTLVVGHFTNSHVAITQNTISTDSSLVLQVKGNGAFILGSPPDGTAANGNARGTNAVDLQLNRNAATQVASGANSLVAGRGCIASGTESIAMGRFCTASGSSAVALGDINTASAGLSTALGYGAVADRNRMFAHSGNLIATVGDAQFIRFVPWRKTTNDTPVTLLTNGTAFRMTIPSGKVFSFIAQITGIKSDGSAVAKYIREGTIKNVGGTTTMVGSVITVGTDHEDNASTDVAITADDTNNALDISVTGIDAETWRWVAVVQGVEIAYGT